VNVPRSFFVPWFSSGATIFSFAIYCLENVYFQRISKTAFQDGVLTLATTPNVEEQLAVAEPGEKN
jgi:hypothetical protein